MKHDTTVGTITDYAVFYKGFQRIYVVAVIDSQTVSLTTTRLNSMQDLSAIAKDAL